VLSVCCVLLNEWGEMTIRSLFQRIPRVSTRHVFVWLIIANVIGVILPVITILMKGYDGSRFRYYAGYAVFNALILILAFRYKHHLLPIIDRCVEWLHHPTEQYARRTVFTVGMVIFLGYFTKVYLGCWFPAISGWGYEPVTIVINTPIPQHDDASEIELAALNASIVSENARYLKGRCFLENQAMLLHFENGESHPANMELTNIVFPDYVFGAFSDRRNTTALGRIIKGTLENRQNGRRFLLPERVAYPEHATYHRIDYSAQPPADELKRVSFWTVVVDANPDGRTKIVSAKLEDSFDVE